jgi:transcriptional regulator with XRE-family HTH domain
VPGRLNANFAKNVRAFAEARGMPINSLADFAGVSRSYLYALLGRRRRNGPTLAFVEKVGDVLGVDPWDLVLPEHLQKPARRVGSVPKRRARSTVGSRGAQ